MRIRTLQWDVRNTCHLGERNISRDDVAEVCSQNFGLMVRIGRIGRGEKKRFVLVGRNSDGEFLTIVLKPLGGDRYRPITGWVSMQDERKRWRRSK